MFLTSFAFLQAQNIQKQLKVKGNCEMCKSRIEKALDQKGIKKATWNKKSGLLIVIFDSSKMTIEKINTLVNDAGYDTNLSNAPDEKYLLLPECCRYRTGTCDH